MVADIVLYKDVATGAVYVVASRGHQGVTLRDLDSEPGDPEGVIVVSEWGLLGRGPVRTVATVYLAQRPPSVTA